MSAAMPGSATPVVRPTPWQRVQRAWIRATAAVPALRAILPFVPLLAAWWIAAALEVFPKAFFPGPADVVRTFFELIRKGILPEYLADSVTRPSAIEIRPAFAVPPFTIGPLKTVSPLPASVRMRPVPSLAFRRNVVPDTTSVLPVTRLFVS